MTNKTIVQLLETKAQAETTIQAVIVETLSQINNTLALILQALPQCQKSAGTDGGETKEIEVTVSKESGVKQSKKSSSAKKTTVLIEEPKIEKAASEAITEVVTRDQLYTAAVAYISDNGEEALLSKFTGVNPAYTTLSAIPVEAYPIVLKALKA